MGKLNKNLVLVEGRELNQKMVRETTAIAKNKFGMKTKLIKVFDSDLIAENRMEEIFPYDFVLWRGIDKMRTMYEIERVRYWLNQAPNKITINTNVVGGRICTSDKFFQHGIFMNDKNTSEHTLPCFTAFSRGNLERLMEKGDLQYPFVLKPDFGTRGLGIELIRNKTDLDRFNWGKQSFSAEPYIESTYDWRVITLGGVVIAIMRKTGDKGDERNFEAKSGGRTHDNEVDPVVRAELSKIGLSAAYASGLEYSGIDFIRDNKSQKYYILETNVCGGWQNGVEDATGINVPTEILNWFLDRALILEEPTREAVKIYIENRLKFISVESQKLYREVVEYKFDTKMSAEVAKIGLRIQENSLLNKLLAAYTLVLSAELDPEMRARIQDLLYLVENYELSRFGNYVGKGSMEETILESSLYIAVAGKMAKLD